MATNHGPLTRQQRRALERAAKKAARGAVAVGALFAAGAASAATITVNSLADTTVAGDTQCTLREALNNANGNADTTGGDCTAGVAGLDTIVFKAGLTGTITLGGTELPNITDAVTVNGPGAAVITISGNTASRIFEACNCAATTPFNININNLTLTGGNEVYGGAISIDSENVTIDHVVATGNTATSGGAIAFSDYQGATLTVTNSTISGNTTSDIGGGIAIYNAHGALTITNDVISGNTAQYTGGGIYAEYLYAPTSISGSTISGNTTAIAYGGGIYASELKASLTISNSTLSGNLAGITSAGHGGALEVLYTYSSVYLQHDTFGGPNASDANKAGIEAGAINVVMADGAFFQMQNTHVLNNVAGTTTPQFGDSGGVRLEASGELAARATAEITDSVISGNIADPQDAMASGGNNYDLGYGGGLYLKGYLSTTVTNTTISGNTAKVGAGVYVYTYADATFVDCTIANNTAANPDLPGSGGGVQLNTHSGATFDETTISGNTTQAGGAGINAYLGSITLSNSIVANSTGGPDIATNGESTITANYTLVENPGALVLGGTGNITGTDPALGALADNGSTILAGNPNGTQVHPQTELPASNSPVVNTGDPAFTPPPATDERGFARVQSGRIDMGAVEVAPPANVDVAITKSAGAGPFFAGQNMTYSISVHNNGPGSASSVTVTDAIPAGTTYVSAVPSQGSCSGTTTVTCNLGTLANAGSASISLTVTPNNAGPVSNTANVASTETDTNPANNSSTSNVTVHPATDIPALSDWVLMMLASLLGLLGFVKAKD